MRIALVFPPLADAAQPYSSLPALAGYLHQRGRHEAIVHDANLEFVRYALTAKGVEESASPDSWKAPIVAAAIDGAVADLQRPETFRDLARLDHAKRVVRDGLEIVAGSATLLTNFLEEVTLPWIERQAPGAIGISITYRSQIDAAIALARLAKRHVPRVPLIVGGHIPSVWYSTGLSPEIFDWCDYVIPFEGEAALDDLLSALERGRRPDRTAQAAVAIDDLPAPDYRGMPLDRYLAPEPVLLLNTSRGCYWSRCEFCSVSPSMRNQFRMRRPELVLADVATLQARHGARCISFGDDCISPRMLDALTAIRGVSWQCEVRFERKLTAALLGRLRDAGCRNLIFGLESYSPRVLRAMNKGVRHAEIVRILDDCRRHDIAFNLQLFFGFPGETEEDAQATIDFVKTQLRGAATVSFGEFKLQRGSGVARRPEAFGIRIAGEESPQSIQLDYAPLPRHAAGMRRTLHEEVLGRTRFHALPLGLDAHTLLYLHHSGVKAMSADYYKEAARQAPRITANAKLVRNQRQIVNGSILYDYDRDRAVELSRLARWIVTEQLVEPRSAREIADTLAAATGSRLTRTVTGVLRDLAARGMVSVKS